MSCSDKPVPLMYVKKGICNQWVKNFQTMIASKLPDSNDYTTSLFYDLNKLKELISEAECHNASGIRIYFAAYSSSPNCEADDGNINNTSGEVHIMPKDKGYEGKMALIFTIVKNVAGEQTDIFIDDDLDFPQRPRQFPFDTGVPCKHCKGEMLPYTL